MYLLPATQPMCWMMLSPHLSQLNAAATQQVRMRQLPLQAKCWRTSGSCVGPWLPSCFIPARHLRNTAAGVMKT